MHILLLTVSYKSSFNQHSAPFFRDQAIALKENGFRVGVICALPISFKSIFKNRLLSFKQESYVDEGIKTVVYPFPSFPKMPNRSKRIRFKKGKILLKNYINQNGTPDVIHVHSYAAGELAFWIKKKYNIPYVVTEHSSSFELKLLSKSNIKLAKKVFENSSCNIAVSKSMASAIKYYFNEFEFKIIANVVDTEFFSLKENKENKNYQFINIAHLNRNKNQLHLIDSFTQAFKANQHYKLLIVGEGPERKNLEKQIRKHAMNSQIKLFGAAKKEKVKELLHSSNCFVLSSIVETFGVVIIEAMSCGLPVLSTKCGGPESIITSDTLGSLCNYEDLKDKMKDISKQKFSGSTIRKYAVNSFSKSSLFNQLKVIYFDCQK